MEATGRRQSLLEAKLRGLARTVWGDAVDLAQTGPFPGGAAMATADEAWVLADQRPERALGPALAWARRRRATQVRLLVDSEAGALARRSSYFDHPAEVWWIEATALSPAGPAPLPTLSPLDPRAERFRPDLLAAGAEPVVEHGILVGEVLGLEVARVVIDGDVVRLAIGVGRNDREAHRLVHGEAPRVEDLSTVVRAVVEHRVPDGEGHDAYHLAAERWLRAVVVAHPALVGASSLVPVPPPVRRPDLRTAAPAPAAGVDTAGRPLLVVCSAGVDLDLVPMAADARAADGRDPRLVLCLPEGDDHRVTRDLASALVHPAEVVTVPGDWRRLLPRPGLT